MRTTQTGQTLIWVLVVVLGGAAGGMGLLYMQEQEALQQSQKGKKRAERSLEQVEQERDRYQRRAEQLQRDHYEAQTILTALNRQVKEVEAQILQQEVQQRQTLELHSSCLP